MGAVEVEISLLPLFCFVPVCSELRSLASKAWLLFKLVVSDVNKLSTEKEQLLHHAVSLRYHGFLVELFKNVGAV